MRTGRPRVPLRARLERSIVIDDAQGCWLWTRRLTTSGYATIGAGGAKGKLLMAHRASYQIFVGAIPEGLTLDHLCRVRHCVNPGHLEPVTMAENILRGTGPAALNALKTRCDHGHPFTPENTQFADGKRYCRACARRRTRDWQRRNRAHRAAYARTRRAMGLRA